MRASVFLCRVFLVSGVLSEMSCDTRKTTVDLCEASQADSLSVIYCPGSTVCASSEGSGETLQLPSLFDHTISTLFIGHVLPGQKCVRTGIVLYSHVLNYLVQGPDSETELK